MRFWSRSARSSKRQHRHSSVLPDHTAPDQLRTRRFAVDRRTAEHGLVALADRIELWPIHRLRPYERNPRTHSEAQVDQIAASMVQFGWTNPVLVDEQGGLLAGHGRLLAARKLGLEEVPVIRFEHLSEAQKRACVLADNQLGRRAAGGGAGLAFVAQPKDAGPNRPTLVGVDAARRWL